jgi:hypothetical protein
MVNFKCYHKLVKTTIKLTSLPGWSISMMI